MKLYVCMVLAGSICTFLYIFLNCVLPYEFDLKWKKIFIRINIMFYLPIFPWIMVKLKENLRALINKTGIFFSSDKIPNMINTKNVWESIIVDNVDGKIIYITGYQKLLLFVIAMSFIFWMLITGWLIGYLIICCHYKRDIIYLDADKYLKNIKQKNWIRVSASVHVTSPITIGIIKPIILFPIDRENYESAMEGIIQHELTHICNLDILFRFFTFAIIAVQWYNPLTYYLLRENIAVSELLCDEAATDGMSKEEKLCYMRCIIAATEEKKNLETLVIALGATKGLSKRRLKIIMNKNEKKFWRRNLAVGILIVCFIVSSIPAMAYEEPIKHTYDINSVSQEWINVDKVTFMPEEAERKETIGIEFDLNNGVFVSKVGETYFYNNFELSDENQMHSACLHTYQAGTYSMHETKDDGGCVVTVYNAKRCSKCGHIIIGEEIEMHTYKVCPH